MDLNGNKVINKKDKCKKNYVLKWELYKQKNILIPKIKIKQIKIRRELVSFA